MEARGPGQVLFLLQLVAAALSQRDHRAAATAVCTELAVRFDLERVSVGFLQGGRARVEALSHNTSLDQRQDLVRDLAAAMEEAADQDRCVVSPALRDAGPVIARAHERLCGRHGGGFAISVPLVRSGRVVGVLTAEGRAEARPAAEGARLLEDAGALLGPLLALSREASSGPLTGLRGWWRNRVRPAFGPDRPGMRLAAAAAVALVSLTTLTPVSHRVRADATLEGRTQRAIVAGLDGFVAEARVRAGDLVKEGDVLGRLDERELLLERQKSRASLDKLQNERRQAMADHDAAKIRIAGARLAQAEAQLELIDDLLARTRLLAPFDGIVVRGDLSRSLGSPVSKGDVLFEVAPLDGYKIVLDVDERDLAHVQVGSRGSLTLTAAPGERIGFTIERVTPVAVAEDGRTFFRAEARVDEPRDSLRPGMAGVAKVTAGRRSLVWIWTHELVDWLRLRAWALWA